MHNKMYQHRDNRVYMMNVAELYFDCVDFDVTYLQCLSLAYVFRHRVFDWRLLAAFRRSKCPWCHLRRRAYPRTAIVSLPFVRQSSHGRIYIYHLCHIGRPWRRRKRPISDPFLFPLFAFVPAEIGRPSPFALSVSSLFHPFWHCSDQADGGRHFSPVSQLVQWISGFSLLSCFSDRMFCPVRRWVKKEKLLDDPVWLVCGRHAKHTYPCIVLLY